VDTTGHVIKSYGVGLHLSGGKTVNTPLYLAVDMYNNILVADHSRLQLLSPTLTHLGEIVIPGHQLNQPYALHFDELNHRLFIGELNGGRIFELHDIIDIH